MVILYILAALIGGLATAVWLWNDSPLLALAMAPLGGSAIWLLVALVVTHWRLGAVRDTDDPPVERHPESVWIRPLRQG